MQVYPWNNIFFDLAKRILTRSLSYMRVNPVTNFLNNLSGRALFDTLSKNTVKSQAHLDKRIMMSVLSKNR